MTNDNEQQLKRRIEDLERQVKHLQESVGKWRRKAQGSAPRFEYVAERHERGMHFISVPVTGAPADMTLHEIQKYVRLHVLPKFYPYRYWNVYTSKRYGGWVTTLIVDDNVVDMRN